MTYKELHSSFELEATGNFMNMDDKPMSVEIEYWLNLGLDNFIKSRYSGYNTRLKGFEQEQKRIDDLRTLVNEVKLYTNSTDKEEYILEEFPEDYMFLLGDRVGLLPLNGEALDCWKTDNEGLCKVLYVDPIQATTDNIDQNRSNTLSDHRYHRGKAKPLRIERGKNLIYITDGNYMVDHSIITYLRKPSHIDIHTNPLQEYTDMPAHTHPEIIGFAVQAYLENKKSNRYQSYQNETII